MNLTMKSLMELARDAIEDGGAPHQRTPECLSPRQIYELAQFLGPIPVPAELESIGDSETSAATEPEAVAETTGSPLFPNERRHMITCPLCLADVKRLRRRLPIINSPDFFKIPPDDDCKSEEPEAAPDSPSNPLSANLPVRPPTNRTVGAAKAGMQSSVQATENGQINIPKSRK